MVRGSTASWSTSTLVHGPTSNINSTVLLFRKFRTRIDGPVNSTCQSCTMGATDPG